MNPEVSGSLGTIGELRCPRCGDNHSAEFEWPSPGDGWRKWLCISCADKGYQVHWEIFAGYEATKIRNRAVAKALKEAHES